MSREGLEAGLAGAEAVRAARGALAGRAAWIVGGAVRNALLGEQVRDIDLAVEPGSEEEVARALARAGSGFAFPLSAEHATWRAVAAGEAWHADVTALRAPAIEGDLRLRDFTVNAVALPLEGGDPLDPTGGIADARARSLRVVSDGAFADDPLRLLRAPRLASRYGLELEAGTAKLARSQAQRAADPAGERQFAELRAMVAGPDPLGALALLDQLGLTAVVLPEVEAMRGLAQTANHHLDVHAHTVAVLEQQLEIERDLPRFCGDAAPAMAELLAEPLADELTRSEALRFGALLHDVGKPATRGVIEGRVTFIGHDRAGAEMIASLCRRLKTSRRLSVHLEGLALHHLHLGFMVHDRPLSRRRVYDYLRTTEPVGPDVTLLTAADRLAARGEGPLASEEMVAAHLELVRETLPAALAWHADPPRPPLSGDELAVEAGIEPGPRMGEILEELRAAAFTGEAPDRDSALELARGLASG
ncbi:MAG TPA: HDIG domain-containing protein [Solirubrobacterales bacterium]|nr:HDIG domain-containing protein [Solirubrobacterales bacterium]